MGRGQFDAGVNGLIIWLFEVRIYQYVFAMLKLQDQKVAGLHKCSLRINVKIDRVKLLVIFNFFKI